MEDDSQKPRRWIDVTTERHQTGEHPDTPQPKLRVVVFGSYKRGYAILNTLLNDKELMKRIEIVGVATDDPKQKYTSADIRVWRHMTEKEREEAAQLVPDLARAHDIPVYDGWIKGKKFYDKLEHEWKPDVIYMGTYGQILDEKIIKTPIFEAFNNHPSDGIHWPSFEGPQPFEDMFAAKIPACSICLNQINEKQDDGRFSCFSPLIDIPYDQMESMTLGEKVKMMHEITSPHAGLMVDAHLRSELGMPLTSELSYYESRLPVTDKTSQETHPATYEDGPKSIAPRQFRRRDMLDLGDELNLGEQLNLGNKLKLGNPLDLDNDRPGNARG